MSTFLRRGVTAGAAAGLAMAAVLAGLGQRPLTEAIAIEEAAGHGGEALFTRPQQIVGAMVALVLTGLAVGAVFGVVFAAVRHRLAGDDRRRSLVLAGAGFVTLSLVPFLKYPPNPPAVGDPSTVGRRTALYLGLLACSVIVTWAAWRLSRTLAATNATLAVPLVAVGFVVAVATAFVALPGSPDAVDLPAALVWRFRMSSLAGAASFWAVLGAVHAWLASRSGDDRAPAVAG